MSTAGAAEGAASAATSPAALTTARLRLRPITTADAAFVQELVNDPDWLRYIGDKHVHSLDDARGYIEKGPLAMYAQHGLGLLVVELADGTPIGMCGLIRRESLPDVDIGFAFLPAHRGHGYAREAAQATLRYGRETAGLQRIVAITSRDNDASGRLLEAVGLRFERMLPIPGEDREVRLYAWNAA